MVAAQAPAGCSTKRWDFNSASDMNDFVGDSCPQQGYVENGNMVWALTKECGATTYAYNKRVNQGKIRASIKAAPTNGTVTAFIMYGFPDEKKDEIDFEWVGLDLSTARSMYFYDGKRAPTGKQEEGYHAVAGNNAGAAFNTYEIEFTDEYIRWSVNDVKVRELIYSATTASYFPKTADRLQFGTWDGSKQIYWAGTTDWAAIGGKTYAYMDWLEVTDYESCDGSAESSSTEVVEPTTSTSADDVDPTSSDNTAPTGGDDDDEEGEEGEGGEEEGTTSSTPSGSSSGPQPTHPPKCKPKRRH
ncbi:hypothetical protein H4R34_003865 [Dimargaris verticillata]|uniref:GH16 domain-containing protein n=1 Tax=Dimargaris verticillata TaxID=2761393 RepID=A0A9W8E7T2_9FUNG|nr:hypothetical protein H4R34_003865 [Dimargaris verticillata]